MTQGNGNGDREFVKITNRQIWEELIAIKEKVSKIELLRQAMEDHESRIRKLEVRVPSIIGGALFGVAVVLKVAGVI